MQTLFATPPIAEPKVATATFIKRSFEPVARAVYLLNANRIPIDRGTEVKRAAMKPKVTSAVVYGDFFEMFP